MAMIQLRDGRELKVKELVEELELTPGQLVEVTEVRRVVLRKFHSPIDNLDEFVEEEVKHMINVDQIMDVHPTVEEAAIRPVVGEFAKAKAVSGPFEKNYERILFDCDHADELHLEGQKGMGDIVVDGKEAFEEGEEVTRDNFDDIKMM